MPPILTCCCGTCYFVAVRCECNAKECDEIAYIRCADVEAFLPADSVVVRDSKTGCCYEIDLTQEPIVDGKPAGPFIVFRSAHDDCEECCNVPPEECFTWCATTCPTAFVLTFGTNQFREQRSSDTGTGNPGCNFIAYTVDVDYTVGGEVTYATTVHPSLGPPFCAPVGGIVVTQTLFGQTSTPDLATISHSGGSGCDTVVLNDILFKFEWDVDCDSTASPVCSVYGFDAVQQGLGCATKWALSPGYFTTGIPTGPAGSLPPEVVAAIMAAPTTTVMVAFIQTSDSFGFPGIKTIYATAPMPTNGCPTAATFTNAGRAFFHSGVWDSVVLDVVGAVTCA